MSLFMGKACAGLGLYMPTYFCCALGSSWLLDAAATPPFRNMHEIIMSDNWMGPRRTFHPGLVKT